MPISTDDYVAISDLLGRYCWAVDEGDVEAWVALWTVDGVFTGATPEPAVGHEGLRAVPPFAMSVGQGKLRHHVGNLFCDYMDERAVVQARYYNLVSDWRNGGSLFCLALTTAILVRAGNGWLIKRSESEMFTQ